MVSQDIYQVVEGRFETPEVRVWIHPRNGLIQSDAAAGDEPIVYDGESLNDKLEAALQDIEDIPISEARPLIAYDGYEFQVYEFIDMELVGQRPPHPERDTHDDPLLTRLTPGAFFEIHDGDKRTVVDLMIAHTGDLETLYHAIKTHENPAPSQDDLAATGLDFQPLHNPQGTSTDAESKSVNVGFSAPGSVWVEVDDPSDLEAVVSAFTDRLDAMDDDELLEAIETDPKWLAENLHYVDSEDGDVYHEW